MSNWKPMREVFLEMLKERLNPPPSIRLPLWSRFNDMSGGFRAHEFSIFCGSTGIGKTTWLANLSYQFQLANARHGIMSVETGAKDYAARITSVYAKYDINAVDNVPQEVFTRVVNDHQRDLLKDGTYFTLYEDRISVEQIQEDIEFAVKTYGVEVVLIDNLNYLLDVRNARDQYVEMDRVTHSLIAFCKKTPVHIVMVMHSNKPEDRSGADYGRVENEFQIKGSSTAVQEAQNVFLFNRPLKEDIDNGTRLYTDRELKIAKMRRRGMFVGHQVVFANAETRYTEIGATDFLGRYQGDPRGNPQALSRQPGRSRAPANRDWLPDA